MASADMGWPFYSGERNEAHGSLVYYNFSEKIGLVISSESAARLRFYTKSQALLKTNSEYCLLQL